MDNNLSDMLSTEQRKSLKKLKLKQKKQGKRERARYAMQIEKSIARLQKFASIMVKAWSSTRLFSPCATCTKRGRTCTFIHRSLNCNMTDVFDGTDEILINVQLLIKKQENLLEKQRQFMKDMGDI